jgi:hypothetical protein
MVIVSSGVVWHNRPAVWAAATGIGALAALGFLLWHLYGSAVFLEMIAAGLASCF